VPAIENCKLDKLTPEIEEWTPIGGQLGFENNPVLLLRKLQQLREAAKPFVALHHYFEHGSITVSNKPLTIHAATYATLQRQRSERAVRRYSVSPPSSSRRANPSEYLKVTINSAVSPAQLILRSHGADRISRERWKNRKRVS
jgi:hypothetical protein